MAEPVNPQARRAVTAAVVGNILEWYDFAVYAYMAAAIARHFFPADSETSSLLATFAVNMIIIGIGTALFTTSPRNVDFTLGRLSLGPITLPWTRVAAALASALVTALLYLFLQRTQPGKAIRLGSTYGPVDKAKRATVSSIIRTAATGNSPTAVSPDSITASV